MVLNIFSKKFLRLSKLSSRPTQGHSGVREGEVRLYDERREDHAFYKNLINYIVNNYLTFKDLNGLQ